MNCVKEDWVVKEGREEKVVVLISPTNKKLTINRSHLLIKKMFFFLQLSAVLHVTFELNAIYGVLKCG